MRSFSAAQDTCAAAVHSLASSLRLRLRSRPRAPAVAREWASSSWSIQP